MHGKPGRPSILSRDLILNAAMEAAAANPANPVSVSQVARHLKVTPMAIYGYFANRDELLQALSGQLLAGFVVEVEDDMPPVKRIIIWAYAVRRHFLTYPQLITILAWEGGHSSVAWMNQSRILFDALEELGLDGDMMPEITLWLWNTVLATIKFQIFDRQQPARITSAELDDLDSRIKSSVGRVQQFMLEQGQHDRFFAFQMRLLSENLHRLAQGEKG